MNKKYLCVIGSPVKHSLSPIIHAVAIKELNRPYVYTKVEVKPSNLASFLREAKQKYLGFNVTLPHKVSILPFLDELDTSARQIGAVNTVVCKNNSFIGFNTDALGFLRGLQVKGFSVKNKKIVIFGAGGATRAVVFALGKENAIQITLGIRDITKIAWVRESFLNLFPLNVYFYQDEKFLEDLKEADLIINATPLGMYPQTEENLPVFWSLVNKGALIYDLIYSPLKTKFLKEAEREGHQVINGTYMLVGQAREAFKLFTGYMPSEQKMLVTLNKILKHKYKKDV